MTFTSGDSATPMATLLNQAVTEGKAYTDAQLAVVNWTAFTPTAGGTSTIGTCRYRKFGPIVELRVEITYQGATVTASAQGDLADTTLLTGVGFPAGILPSQTLNLHGHRFRAGGIRASCGLGMSPTGQLVVFDMYPTATLAANDLVSVTATYATG